MRTTSVAPAPFSITSSTAVKRCDCPVTCKLCRCWYMVYSSGCCWSDRTTRSTWLCPHTGYYLRRGIETGPSNYRYLFFHVLSFVTKFHQMCVIYVLKIDELVDYHGVVYQHEDHTCMWRVLCSRWMQASCGHPPITIRVRPRCRAVTCLLPDRWCDRRRSGNRTYMCERAHVNLVRWRIHHKAIRKLLVVLGQSRVRRLYCKYTCAGKVGGNI